MLQHKAGVGVPCVMETNTFQSGVLCQSCPCVVYTIRQQTYFPICIAAAMAQLEPATGRLCGFAPK
ncbi:hypothetical protein ACFLXF_01670 [Chloroflexota bacterium]